MASTSNSVLAKLAIVIDAQNQGFIKHVQASQNALTGLQKSFSSIQTGLQTLGLSFGAFTVGTVIQSAVKSISDFEKEMSTVKAITGATEDEFKALRKSALDLGASTKYTSQQVAGLQIEYGRLGFTTDEILAASKATLDLATATGEDLAKAADVAGSTVRGFGLNANETQRVVDVMAESFNKTALGLDNFSEAMKYVAPVAAAAGASVEETTALLGTLADAGIRGSMAGTSLRKIFTDVAKDGRPLQVRLDELGKKGITLSDAMDEVGRTAQTSLIILSKNTEKTKELTKAFENSAGAGAEAARIMGDNLAGDVDKLSSAYDGLVLSTGNSTSGLREFVSTGTAVLNALNAHNGVLGEYVSKWLKLVFLIPRTVAGIVRAGGELISGTERLSKSQVEEAIRVTNELREKAKLEGNEKDVLEYTKAIAYLTSKYGLLKDKAVEFKEEAVNTKPQQEAAVGLIESLEIQLKDLEDKKKAAFSVRAIEQFNTKISDLKIKLELLNASRPLSAFARGVGSAIKEAKDRVSELSNALVLTDGGLDVAPLVINLNALNEAYDKSGKKTEDWVQNAEYQFGEYEKSLVDFSGVVNSALSGIGQALGSAISGSETLGAGLLKVLGGVLVQLGEMLITAGLGVEAFKESLKSLNGYVAIAAGVALIALGTAISSSISSLGGGGRSGGSSAKTSAGGVINTNSPTFILEGELRIDGRDLVYVYDKNKRLDLNRTNG